MALSIANLANHLAHGGDFAGALEVTERAIKILNETVGLEHPWMATILGNQGQFLFRAGRFEREKTTNNK